MAEQEELMLDEFELKERLEEIQQQKQMIDILTGQKHGSALMGL